jgi:hypothetical protein
MLLALGVIPKSLDFLLNVWTSNCYLYHIDINQSFSKTNYVPQLLTISIVEDVDPRWN